MEQTKLENKRKCEETTEGCEELEYLKQFHDEAFLYISQALTCEENGDEEAALILYERGLRLIDQALSIQTSGGNCVGPQWENAEHSKKKMRQTRQKILESLERLRSSRQSHTSSFNAADGPPSYEEAVRSSTQWSNHNSREGACSQEQNTTLQQKASQIQAHCQSMGLRTCLDEVPVNAEQIFNLPEVQIFFVSTDGYVTAPSYPTALIVYRINEEQQAAAATPGINPVGILQVGDWIYPLQPGCSPVLQSSYGAYMFPNIEDSDHPGAAVGILLPDDVDEETKELFEHLMCEFTALQSGATITEETVSRFRLSRRLSSGLIKGAEMLARGIGFGAEQTAKLVHLGASKLRTNLAASDPVHVNPKVNNGLKVARNVTHAAVGVSSYIGKAVGQATMSLGRFLAPHVRHHGSQLLAKAFKEDPKKSDKKIDSVLEVAAGGLQGFATIYISLESAARILATSLTNETVQIVGQRYGPTLADTTGNALFSLGNTAMTVHNLHVLGIRGLAKSTATNTARALVEDFQSRGESSSDKSRRMDDQNRTPNTQEKKVDDEKKNSNTKEKMDEDDDEKKNSVTREKMEEDDNDCSKNKKDSDCCKK